MKKMKKLVAAALALLLIPALCACEELDALRSQLPDPPKIDETAPPSEDVTEPVETETPDSSELITPVNAEDGTGVYVSFTTDTKECYDPNDGSQLILSFSSVVPRVSIAGAEDSVVSKINEALGLIEETYYTGNDHGYGTSTGYNMMLELAEDNYSYIMGSGAEDMPMQFSASRTVSVARADGAVISLMYNDYEFTGGDHGSTTIRSYVFDTQTGDIVSIDSLSADPAALRDAILDSMKTAIDEDKDGYYSQRVDLTGGDLDGTLSALLKTGSWGFGDKGLEIRANLYELGSYAAGIVEFTVPYEALSGTMDAKWFPAAKSGEGSLSISPLDSVDDGSVEIVSRVVIDPNGKEYCLKAEGTVYDLTVSAGMFAEQFYKNTDIWYANRLSDGAVQLQLTLPEGLPELMVSYRDATGSRSLFITGNDSGVTLTDPSSVQAVG